MTIRRRLQRLAVLLVFAAASATLHGQAERVEVDHATLAIPATASEAIQQMSAAAGVIFAGQVMAVRRPQGASGQGIVEIDFRVDEAVRGPLAGETYTLREWAGQWSGHFERYRVGQRLLMFLHPADDRRLTSPVSGAVGAVPIRGGGMAPGPDDATTETAQWLIDLRWIQTRTLRDSPQRAAYRENPTTPPVMTPWRGIREETLTPMIAREYQQQQGLPQRSEEPTYVALPSGMESSSQAEFWKAEFRQSEFRRPVAPTIAVVLTQPNTEPLDEVLELCRQGARVRGAAQ